MMAYARNPNYTTYSINDQNYTTSKTKFYYTFSDQSLAMTHNVVKFGFRCSIIWILTRDY